MLSPLIHDLARRCTTRKWSWRETKHGRCREKNTTHGTQVHCWFEILYIDFVRLLPAHENNHERKLLPQSKATTRTGLTQRRTITQTGRRPCPVGPSRLRTPPTCPGHQPHRASVCRRRCAPSAAPSPSRRSVHRRRVRDVRPTRCSCRSSRSRTSRTRRTLCSASASCAVCLVLRTCRDSLRAAQRASR